MLAAGVIGDRGCVDMVRGGGAVWRVFEHSARGLSVGLCSVMRAQGVLRVWEEGDVFG